MRVVIIGAGDLGRTIAEWLSRENHDVIIVDQEEKALALLRNMPDVLAFCGDGTHPALARQPDLSGADLWVAVTNRDETNILSCLLAKKQGVPATMACLRDPKFVEENPEEWKESFGIDEILCPDRLMAEEIARLLMMPAALNVEDFAEGKVRMYETVIPKGSSYVDRPLKELSLPSSVLVAMIGREGKVLIPHGEDVLHPFDRVYFVGMAEDISQISEDGAPLWTKKAEKVMIVGAGKTTQVLAPLLESAGMSLKVIDKNKKRCEDMAEKIHGKVLWGDGSDMDFLEREGAAEADAVICTTKEEQLNLLMALLAKHLGAGRTIVRVVKSVYAELMARTGVDVTLSPRLLVAGTVLGYVRQHGVVSVTLLESAKVEAIETRLLSGAPLDGCPLKQVHLPKELLLCAYVRDGHTFIPKGDTTLLAGDRVIFLTPSDRSDDVWKYFKGRDLS